jgi:hypothetical protein
MNSLFASDLFVYLEAVSANNPFCRTKIYFAEHYHKNNSEYPNFPSIDRIGLQGDAMNVSICTDNEKNDKDMRLFDDCLHQDDEIISERLRILSSLLTQLEY